jgi:hypothetical protein
MIVDVLLTIDDIPHRVVLVRVYAEAVPTRIFPQ